jgi:DNA-directed RNA polymerase subunit RPC12/RpoP
MIEEVNEMGYYTCICSECGRVFTVSLNSDIEMGLVKCTGCGSRELRLVPLEVFSGGS